VAGGPRGLENASQALVHFLYIIFSIFLYNSLQGASMKRAQKKPNASFVPKVSFFKFNLRVF
jgi:hypothetical protein